MNIDIDMVITIVFSVVVANVINITVVNPLINIIFGCNRQYKSAGQIVENLPSSSKSESKSY